MSALVHEMPFSELVLARFSPKSFEDRPVPSEILVQLFEAARWSPSAFNDQPWGFVVATRENPEDFDRLLGSLVPRNAQWAAQAPVLILAAARTAFQHNGKPNRHAIYDLGQSVAWLSAKATTLGLSLHQMAGFDPTKAATAAGLPEGWEAVTMIALGYSQELPAPTRTRRPLSTLVHNGQWGRPFPKP